MTDPTPRAVAVQVYPGTTEAEAARIRFGGQQPPEGVELVFVHNPLLETGDLDRIWQNAEALAADIHTVAQEQAARRAALRGWASVLQRSGARPLSELARAAIDGVV